MIYSRALCIHNRHFINWIVLGVTQHINVIAVNSALVHIFRPMSSVGLEVPTILTCSFRLNIVNAHWGKPKVYTETIRQQKNRAWRLLPGMAPGRPPQVTPKGGERVYDGPEGLCARSYTELLLLLMPGNVNRWMRKKMGERGKAKWRTPGVQLSGFPEILLKAGLHPLYNIKYEQKK